MCWCEHVWPKTCKRQLTGAVLAFHHVYPRLEPRPLTPRALSSAEPCGLIRSCARWGATRCSYWLISPHREPRPHHAFLPLALCCTGPPLDLDPADPCSIHAAETSQDYQTPQVFVVTRLVLQEMLKGAYNTSKRIVSVTEENKTQQWK